MKRIFAFVMVLVLVAFAAPSLAAGKLVPSRENLHVIPYYTTSVYCNFYAELKNEGDKPVEFSSGLLELFDPDGNSIVSSGITYCYPKVLQPGEVGYLYSNSYVETADKNFIDDHMLSVTGQGKITQTIVRLDASAVLETVSDGYYTYNYLTALIKNNTEEIVKSFEIVYALKDAEGNLLYVVNSYWSGYNFGIMPGSSVQMQVQMDSTVLNYLTENIIVPAVTECIVYSVAPVK